MKNKTITAIHIFIFCIVFDSSSVLGMDFTRTSLADPEKVIKTILSSVAPNPLSPIYDGDAITTKSQAPDPNRVQRRQNASQVFLNGKAIRERGGEDNSSANNTTIQDTRSRVTPVDWPYSAHGVVSMKFRVGPDKWGTGTLISPYLVLTAAHNLYDCSNAADGEPIGEATEIRFIPARDGNTAPFGECNVIKSYFTKKYKETATPNGDGDEDYGLLLLDNPIGEETGYFGLQIVPSDYIKTLNINVTGYPSDKIKDKPQGVHEMWSMKGTAEEVNQDFIDYKIYTEHGNSGGGVWHQEGEDYFVVGIHVLKVKEANKASLLTKSRYNQIMEWTQESIKEIIERGMGGCEEITEINLTNKYIEDFGVNYLCGLSFLHLNTLNLSENNIRDSGIERLENIPTLTSLNLSCNQISCQGANALTALTNLRKLNLSNNIIRDNGIKILSQHPALSFLDVSCNLIGTNGAIDILHSKTLIRLNLSNNNINTIDPLIFAISHNTRLKILNFGISHRVLDTAFEWAELGQPIITIGTAITDVITSYINWLEPTEDEISPTLPLTPIIGKKKLVRSSIKFLMGDEEVEVLRKNKSLTQLTLDSNWIIETSVEDSIKDWILSNKRR